MLPHLFWCRRQPAWEAVRPEQPTTIDFKTGEQVHVLFSVRARSVARAYLNCFLIPTLCRKGSAYLPAASAGEAILQNGG
jgi:hypothetical protein